MQPGTRVWVQVGVKGEGELEGKTGRRHITKGLHSEGTIGPWRQWTAGSYDSLAKLSLI